MLFGAVRSAGLLVVCVAAAACGEVAQGSLRSDSGLAACCMDRVCVYQMGCN